jgi:hypothetical protein
MAKQARPAPKEREPSDEVLPLLKEFANVEDEKAPDVLQEFLELVELKAQQNSKWLLERSALNDRLLAVASRRK